MSPRRKATVEPEPEPALVAFYEIRCPRCGNYATVESSRPYAADWTFSSQDLGIQEMETGRWRFTCTRCPWRPDIPFRVHKGLFWYQGEVEGVLVWAFNREHMLALVDYIAEPQQRADREAGAWGYYMRRLPRELTNARHRERVVTKLERLLWQLPAAR